MAFSIFSTEVVLVIKENLVFERKVMEKSDYSWWGRGLLGWTKWDRECLDSNSVSPEYLFMQKRTGSIGETEQGLPLKYSGVHLWSSGSWTTASENEPVEQSEHGTGACQRCSQLWARWGLRGGLGCCRWVRRACCKPFAQKPGLAQRVYERWAVREPPVKGGWQSQKA